MRVPRFSGLSILSTIAVLSIAMSCVVAIWLRRDSTNYAPGYSWSKFSSIRNGMTPVEVTRILGQPLSIEQFSGGLYGSPPNAYTIPRQTMYWYTRLRNVKGEYVMLIHFDESGKVYQIDADRIGHYCATPGNSPRPSSFLEWFEWYVL